MTDAPERLTAALADRYRLLGELGQGGMATVYLSTSRDRLCVPVAQPESDVRVASLRR